MVQGVLYWREGAESVKALLLTGVRTLSLEEMPAPTPAPEETVLRVLACALCRTDAKMWEKGQRDLILPRVLGHEIYGVEESTGERYIVWPGESCGTCRECLNGAENLCRSMRILGFNKDGGLAEEVRVRRSSLLPVPEGLVGHVATLAEPLGCCLNGLNQVRLRPDSRVLIFGAGPVGLLMALAVHARGAEPFIVERDSTKLSLSRGFRDRTGVSALSVPISDEFDVAINATSSVHAFAEALARLRPGGEFCFFSGLSPEHTIPAQHLNEIHYRQLRVAGAYGCTRANLQEALCVLHDRMDAAELLIEEVITLDRVPGVMERIAAGQSMKVVVGFGG
jgi:L-iditol 2-dehydrogenase